MSGIKGEGKLPPEIRKAAQECLPYLIERATQQRASEQLLRASSQHSVSGEALLRPATAQTDVQPEQMLRASEPAS